MIFDRLENIEKYSGISKLLDKAINLILKKEYLGKMKGSYEVVGRELYYNIDEVSTRKDGDFEIHNRYIDIHILLEGREEIIECGDIDVLEVVKPYDDKRDMEFLKGDSNSFFRMGKDNFLILFPNEPHKPLISSDIENIKKVVFKVRI